MEDTKSFFNVMYPEDVTAQRVRVIYDLVATVMRATEPERHEPSTMTALRSRFRTSVDAALLPFLRDRIVVPKKLAKGIDPGHTDVLLIEQLKDAMRMNTTTEDVFCPYFSDAELLAAAEKGLGMQSLSMESDKCEPTVEAAAKMARASAMHAETAIMCITALHELLKHSQWQQLYLDGSNELRDFLWNRVAYFRNTALMFACLSSDDSLRREFTKWIARGSCYSTSHIDYSIMHFLHFNGRSPGSWASAEDDKFRKAIKAAYLKL